MISPERIIYNIYRKSKKKAQIGGPHASDNIVNIQKRQKPYVPSGLLRCPFCYQIFNFLSVFRVPACIYSSGISLSFGLS